MLDSYASYIGSLLPLNESLDRVLPGAMLVLPLWIVGKPSIPSEEGHFGRLTDKLEGVQPSIHALQTPPLRFL